MVEVGRGRAKLGRGRAKNYRNGPNSSRSGQIRPTLRQPLSKWPDLVAFGQNSAELGGIKAKFGRHRVNFVRNWQIVVDSVLNLPALGPKMIASVPHLADAGQTWRRVAKPPRAPPGPNLLESACNGNGPAPMPQASTVAAPAAAMWLAIMLSRGAHKLSWMRRDTFMCNSGLDSVTWCWRLCTKRLCAKRRQPRLGGGCPWLRCHGRVQGGCRGSGGTSMVSSDKLWAKLGRYVLGAGSMKDPHEVAKGVQQLIPKSEDGSPQRRGRCRPHKARW